MKRTVAEACAALALDRIDFRCRAAKTRKRQSTWDSLPGSAKLLLFFYTGRQPKGWWSLVDHAAARAGVACLTFRHAIEPLFDAGWVVRSADAAIWLTHEGRQVKQRLARAHSWGWRK